MRTKLLNFSSEHSRAYGWRNYTIIDTSGDIFHFHHDDFEIQEGYPREYSFQKLSSRVSEERKYDFLSLAFTKMPKNCSIDKLIEQIMAN